MSFQFGEDDAATESIALTTVIIAGSLGDPSSKFTPIDLNRERLVQRIYNTLKIEGDAWGSAVESCTLMIQGAKEPWTGLISSTLTSARVANVIFGEDGTKTHLLQIQAKIAESSKPNAKEEWKPFEVEIGVAGKYASFKSIGGRGKIVATSNDATNGYPVTVILDRNKGPYEYREHGWQQAAAHYAVSHLQKQLGEKAGIRVLAIETITPLSSKAGKQSARGLRVHLLVTGVNFDREDDDAAGGLGVVQSPAINLIALLPNGKIDAVTDQTTSKVVKRPAVEPTLYKIVINGLVGHGRYRVVGETPYFYPPSAIESKEDDAAWTLVKGIYGRRRGKKKRANGGGGRSQPFGDGGGKGGGTSRGKGGGKGGGSALPHASRWADKEEGEVSDTDSEQSLGKRFRALQQSD